MYQENYSLTWHTFSDHLRDMMRELMMNDEFADVTLVTEDKQHIKAHKNILSSCSPVFRNFMTFDKKSSSIFYLRGINFSELESIIQFIYFGEASLCVEKINEFLSVAKSLEIKGLNNADAETNEFNDTSHLIVPPRESEAEEVMNNQNLVEDQIGETSLPDNQKMNQSVNEKFKCDQCEEEYGMLSHLQAHNESRHKDVEYPCDQCEYKATQETNLWTHIETRHKMDKYNCHQCYYQAT